MMPKRKTKILVLLAFLSAAVSVSAFFILFSLMQGKVADTIAKTDEIQMALEKQRSLSFIQKSIADNQTSENALAGFIIPANSVSDFIQTLEDLVATSSLKSQVNSISYQSSSALSAVGAELVDVQMGVIGTWSNIHFFLELLENYPLKIVIKSASLKQFATYTIAGKQVPEWSLDIEFTAVKFKDN